MTKDGVVAIIPRFDNYYEYTIGGRADYITFNYQSDPAMLQQGLQYDIQHGAKLVMITSYNEYTEGSMIEPHLVEAVQTLAYRLLDDRRGLHVSD